MTKQDRWYSGETQIYWVCKALLDGRTITHMMEIREVKGWRLSAIIHCLRENYGWPIDKEYRGPRHVRYYWLRPGTDIASLRFPPSAAALAEGGQE